jgi:hypothetical protein
VPPRPQGQNARKRSRSHPEDVLARERSRRVLHPAAVALSILNDHWYGSLGTSLIPFSYPVYRARLGEAERSGFGDPVSLDAASADACGRNGTAHLDAHSLEIGSPCASSLPVGVTDVIARAVFLAANYANRRCHEDELLSNRGADYIRPRRRVNRRVRKRCHSCSLTVSERNCQTARMTPTRESLPARDPVRITAKA